MSTREEHGRKGDGPDDYAANFVILLAFCAVFICFFAYHSALALAAVCFSVIGVGLKIAGAVRHAGRRPHP